MTSFLGRYEYQLDQKGRVSLPAAYRRIAAGSRFVLLQWEATHLTLYPEDVWPEVKELLVARRRARADLATPLRRVMSRATEVEPDKQGRILIPVWLQEAAGLNGGVLVVGGMDRIEIWNPERFRRHETGGEADKTEELRGIFG